MLRPIKSMLEAVGSTPLVELSARINPTAAHLFAKVEAANPGGSAKTRVAVAMLDRAEREGKLSPGATVIEPTSGNTGIGLALACAVRGYQMVLVMPDTMSVERIRLARAYGAQVELTPGALGMKGAIARAEELNRSIPGSWVAGQFVNPANPAAHEQFTGPEIFEALSGKIDAFVAGVGTGGTLTGVARALRARGVCSRIVAVEPARSPLLSEGQAGPHALQGIGANFVPETLDRTLVDEVIAVADEAAFAAARDLGAKEGILAGISSGAALAAALELGSRSEYAGKNIVVLLPDTGERYLSCGVFG